MSSENNPHDWGNVDAAEAAETYTEYLETVTDLDAVQAYKHRSYELLEPSEGDRILDVGCGRGDDVLLLAGDVGVNGDVVGVDNSERMIETANERSAEIPTVSFEVGDAQELSVPDDSFDATRADRVLQHLEDPAVAFDELCRVTRLGGRVCVCEPDFRTLLLDTPAGESLDFLSEDHGPNRNPRIGGQLYRLARERELVDLETDSWTFIITDFSFFREAAMLDDWTGAMVESGVVTQSAVDEWYEELQKADQEDMFFYSGTVFIVAGSVPE